MKKILISIACVFFTTGLFAQLQLNSSGNVGIGYTPSSSYKAYIVGDSKIADGGATFLVTNGKIIFKANHAAYAPLEIRANSSDEEPTFAPTDEGVGFVGTSGNPFWKMYTENLWLDGSWITSDIRQKENIRELQSSLESIMNIRGIQYDLIANDQSKWNEKKKIESEKLRNDRFGFAAQELVDVFPNLVHYDEEADQYSVNYVGMIPVLVEAIKEQQTQIEELQAAIGSGEALKGASVTTTNPDLLSSETGTSSLYQNAPNPFTEETSISYSLGETVGSATLFIYDMSGKQLRSYNLYERGDSKITIIGGELDAGMYMYSLVADGLLIGTKQMLLTD